GDALRGYDRRAALGRRGAAGPGMDLRLLAFRAGAAAAQSRVAALRGGAELGGRYCRILCRPRHRAPSACAGSESEEDVGRRGGVYSGVAGLRGALCSPHGSWLLIVMG